MKLLSIVKYFFYRVNGDWFRIFKACLFLHLNLSLFYYFLISHQINVYIYFFICLLVWNVDALYAGHHRAVSFFLLYFLNHWGVTCVTS